MPPSSPSCHRKPRLSIGLAVAAAALAISTAAAAADPIYPPRPVGTHVLDLAKMFPADAVAAADELFDVLDEKVGPMWVVTVPGLAQQGADPAHGWTADAYARGLLAHWAASAPQDREKSAILVFIANGDKRVRVATGVEWLAKTDDVDAIAYVWAYHLERDSAKAAMRDGVKAVHALATGEAIKLPGGYFKIVALFVLFLLFAFSVVNFLRKGQESLAYRMWSGLFSMLGATLTYVFTKGVDLSSRGGGEEPEGERAVIARW